MSCILFTAPLLGCGTKGDKGDPGQTGATGEKGAPGNPGIDGATGATGQTGATGSIGATGPKGDRGDTGMPGVSVGSIAGTLTFRASPSAAPQPASAVTVTDLTLQVTTTTAADGTFSLEMLPIGVHSLKFSGNGYAALQVDGVSVLAARSTTVDRELVATNPIVITPTLATAPAGFGSTVTLSVAVTGAKLPVSYKWVAAAANPTAVTLSATDVASPTTQLGSLQAILAGGKVGGFGQVTELANGALTYVAEPRARFLGVSVQQLAQMTYNFTVTITDADGFVKSATVAVPPATLAQGNSVVPVGQIVIANLPGNSTAATLSVPAGSAAVLNEASTVNPWFVPDVQGTYSVTQGAMVLEATASNFMGANANCGSCHFVLGQYRQAAMQARFSKWDNSAHGNHFFKYMHYDSSGVLVWNTDAAGKPVPAPTANPTVFWSSPGAMTTFEFGMTGAEGTHYSGSCVACHSTGYNALANNGGFDDVARASSWTFPVLANIFTNLTGVTSAQTVVDGQIVTATYDQVTAAPNFIAWNAIPSNVKAMAGMQCESCHGPLTGHTLGLKRVDGTTMVKPQGEYDVAACAVCHDRPANHDRVALWRQSAHANMEVAISEGAGNGSPRASCNRCHSAQGFVQYLKQLTGTLTAADGSPIAGYYPGNLVDPSTSPLADATASYLKGLGITNDQVEPITCAACHDAHSTQVRLVGDTPMLPSGFKVTGAGTGAICFACHNSRNGARNDSLNGVYTNNDNPGTPVAVTAIGAPHEAAQGDVVLGRNAFFVGLYNPSPHLSVEDTCVGCHMKSFPIGVTGTNTNHTFKIDESSCDNCHGGTRTPVDGAALQAQFDGALADLKASLDQVGQSAARGLYYKGSKRTVQLPLDTLAVFVTGRSPGLVLTFTSAIDDPNATSGTISTLGTSSSPAGLGNFYVDAGATTKAFDVLKGTLAKSNWNYSLLANDGSRGVHNPDFAFDVLSASIVALNDPTRAR